MLFGEQLKHDYVQLIAFNRAINQERRAALRQQALDAQKRLADIQNELSELNQRRADSLDFIRNSDSLSKYKYWGKMQSWLSR
ncbi:hypothetical protein Pa4123_57240 [Phytohabitans aurantiacus]|uniref:Uncharacterized protein n=1 Tax=Phytohabitans aurantiacus TaxID=3016789 RepID=A0ABQ5R299_9ACTN|nr:hypothetical protein Pa4123_57240 [Phytohabitans aurantiacus]